MEPQTARTHCYHCGTPLAARHRELLAKLDDDTLAEPELTELNGLDCDNHCWAPYLD